MIKRSIKLEIFDNKGNRLINNNGKYELIEFTKTVHMSKEGPTARVDRNSVNLLKNKLDFDFGLPNVEFYKIVINGYNEYISKHTSVIEPVFTEELVHVEDDTYTKEYMLTLTSKYLNSICGKKFASMSDDMCEEDRIYVVNEIKYMLENINKSMYARDKKKSLVRSK